MPRFFFHLQGTKPIEDRDGVELPDLREAVTHAKEVAHDLMKSKHTPNVSEDWIRVTDDTGVEVYRCPMV